MGVEENTFSGYRSACEELCRGPEGERILCRTPNRILPGAVSSPADGAAGAPRMIQAPVPGVRSGSPRQGPVLVVIEVEGLPAVHGDRQRGGLPGGRRASAADDLRRIDHHVGDMVVFKSVRNIRDRQLCPSVTTQPRSFVRLGCSDLCAGRILLHYARSG